MMMRKINFSEFLIHPGYLKALHFKPPHLISTRVKKCRKFEAPLIGY
jgi:hypothetical protein